jgi:hypothetical protein
MWAPCLGNRDLRQLLWHGIGWCRCGRESRTSSKRFARTKEYDARKDCGASCVEGNLSRSRWLLGVLRRQDLLELADRLNPKIDELSTAIQQAVEQRPE